MEGCYLLRIGCIYIEVLVFCKHWHVRIYYVSALYNVRLLLTFISIAPEAGKMISNPIAHDKTLLLERYHTTKHSATQWITGLCGV